MLSPLSEAVEQIRALERPRSAVSPSPRRSFLNGTPTTFLGSCGPSIAFPSDDLSDLLEPQESNA